MSDDFFYSADKSDSKVHIQGILRIDGYSNATHAFECLLNYLAKELRCDKNNIKVIAFNKI